MLQNVCSAIFYGVIMQSTKVCLYINFINVKRYNFAFHTILILENNLKEKQIMFLLLRQATKYQMLFNKYRY